MVSIVFPKILFNQYFWWAIAFVLIIAFLFVRKKNPLPFPGAGKFFKKHGKGITKIFDILVILIVLLWSFILLPFVWDNLSNPIESDSTQTFIQKLTSMSTFIFLTVWAGVSGFFIGNLSIFQLSITKKKRIILLIACLLPIVFTILHVLNDFTESRWLAVQICIYSSALSWIINIPAVLTGKSFSEILGNIIHKVKLALSHHTE